MNNIKIPVWELFRRSFGYVLLNISYFCKLATIPALIVALTRIFANNSSALIFSMIVSFVFSSFVAVWWNRLIILNETCSLQNLKLSVLGKYIIKYILFIVILIAPAFMSTLVLVVINMEDMHTLANSISAQNVISQENIDLLTIPMVIMIVCSVLCVRLRIALAATAVEDKEINFVMAWNITKGNSIRLFVALLGVSLPIMLLSHILLYALSMVGASIVGALLYFVASSFLTMLLECFYASYDAHAYQYFVYFYRKEIEDNEAKEAGELVEKEIKARRE